MRAHSLPAPSAAARRDARCEAAPAKAAFLRAWNRRPPSCRLHEPQRRSRGCAFLFDLWQAGQMDMRGAIARPLLTRVPAEGDGLALRIAAVGVAAIGWLKIDKRKMPRRDRHASQSKSGGALDRGEPGRLEQDAGALFADLARIRLSGCGKYAAAVRSLGRRQAEAAGAADRSIAGIGGAEAFVQGAGDFLERQPFFHEFAQRG